AHRDAKRYRPHREQGRSADHGRYRENVPLPRRRRSRRASPRREGHQSGQEMKIALALALALVLAACTGEEFGDLKAELKDKTKDMRGRIEPLPVVKPYEPVPYKAFDQPDPFSTAKIELVTKSAVTGGGARLTPDLNRPKEPLEAYPLHPPQIVRLLHQRNTT